MQFSENKLVLDGGREITFNYAVWEIVDFDSVAVVLLKTLAKTGPLPGVNADVNATKGQNVFGISKADGEVLWQIMEIWVSPPPPGESKEMPYVGLRRGTDGTVSATTWSGVSVYLDPLTGKEVRARGGSGR